MSAIKQAAERVRKYLDQRALYRTLDQEAIAAINIGIDDEAWLMTSDLRELVGASAITPKEPTREELEARIVGLEKELKAARRAFRKIERTTNEFDEAREICVAAANRILAALQGVSK